MPREMAPLWGGRACRGRSDGPEHGGQSLPGGGGGHPPAVAAAQREVSELTKDEEVVHTGKRPSASVRAREGWRRQPHRSWRRATCWSLRWVRKALAWQSDPTRGGRDQEEPGGRPPEKWSGRMVRASVWRGHPCRRGGYPWGDWPSTWARQDPGSRASHCHQKRELRRWKGKTGWILRYRTGPKSKC